MKKKQEKCGRYDIIIPAVLFLGLLFFKIVFVVNNRSLPLIADEFTYAKYARALMKNGGYKGVQYPLLYPLLLAPSYLFGENFYLAMKVFNAVYSAAVPVVVYFICRLYMDEKKSGVCGVFSAVIPFQYMTTMAIMSENLYFTLLLLGIYVVLRKFKYEIVGDILLGILLGAMFLTRHITLTLIPVFLLGWLLKQQEEKYKITHIILRGAFVCIIMCITYSPWVIMCKSYGYSLKMIVGFSIASKTNSEQLTWRRLAMTAGFYLSYYILICAPFLGLAVKSFRALDRKKIFSGYNRLWVMVYGLCAALFVAAVRHSWRVAYNYPEFTKIKGRYVIYVPVLVLVAGMAAMYNKKTQFNHTLSNILLAYVLPSAGIVIAYLADIMGVFYDLPSSFIDFYECTDGRRIKILGIAFVVAAIGLMICYEWILDYAKGKIRKYSFLITAMCIIGLEIWGMPQYYAQAKKGNENNCETSYRYAWELIEALERMNAQEERYIIYIGELPEGIGNYIKRATEFYGYKEYSLKNDVEEEKNSEFFAILPEQGEYKENVTETVAEFEWENTNFYLQKVVLD